MTVPAVGVAGTAARAAYAGAVLADVSAPALYRDLVGLEQLPAARVPPTWTGSSGTTRL